MFFFGPMLASLALRWAWLMLRWAWRRRQARRRVITVEIVGERPSWRAPWGFVILSLGVGLASAFLAWRSLHAPPPPKRIYIPAHLENGKLVPGRWVD
ncbi:MAG: hypothetical protein D6771_06180, partial [Zetaproteobacteria bacterium]